MTHLKLNGNAITAIAYVTPKNLDGWIFYDGEMPTAEEGYHLEYRDGMVVAVSDVNASEERRKAYVAECDPLLIASLGYEAEGNAEASKACRSLYLAKKSEIRERFPDEEVAQ